MAVVTISRQFGAGGHTLGESVAQQLGYQLVERDLVTQVAKEANVSVKWVEAVEKEAGGLIMRVCHKLVSSNFIERILGDTSSDFDEDRYVQFVTKVVRELAAEGDVVLVGRGSQFILPDNEETVKVLLVANLEDRIKFMMRQYHLTRLKAEQLVQKEEKRRASFLRLFDSRNPDDPGIYNMVINTSHFDLEAARQMIVQLVGEVLDATARPIW